MGEAMKPYDVIKEYGVTQLKDVDYVGNFTIKYRSKEDLELLQAFFGVRRSKFDMKLLEKRPELLREIRNYNYDKNTDSGNVKSITKHNDRSCSQFDMFTKLSRTG
jgi:hypothetical protein